MALKYGYDVAGGSVYNGFVDPAEQHEINAALIVAMQNALPLLDRLEKAEGNWRGKGKCPFAVPLHPE